ncbi:hypothetical protein [Persephonella sp.]
MKNLKYGILTFTVFACSTYAEDIVWNSSFYGSYFDYSGSVVKDDGYTGGIYGYVGIGLEHSIEGEIDYTKINYLGSGSLKQWDFTLLYTNYSLQGSKIRIGGHYISSDDRATDGGVVLYGGYEQTVDKTYDWGVDGALSYYDNYSIEKTYMRTVTRGKRSWTYYTTASVNGLYVFQVSPKLGITVPSTQIGDIYLETRGYYIGLSDDVGFGQHFFSVEQNISVKYNEFSIDMYGWIGEQEFAVKKYGFAVYNLSEKYRYGFGASVRYNVSDNSFVSAGIRKENFKEIDNPSSADTTTLFAFGGITF